MQKILFKATETAIHQVHEKRFYMSERGFHGRFYCALQAQLDQAGLLNDGAILEMEYQKSSRHGLGQRPDIIFHIPTEFSNAPIQDNNFAVWALKRRATESNAQDDFKKLDQMLDHLRYSIGFFINIDATDPMRTYYTGIHTARLMAVAASLSNDEVVTLWSDA